METIGAGTGTRAKSKQAAEAMKTALDATFGGDRAAMQVECDRIFCDAPTVKNLVGFIDKLRRKGGQGISGSMMLDEPAPLCCCYVVGSFSRRRSIIVVS